MRILAFSDIHGAIERVLPIVEMERDVDVVVVAGDLTTRGSDREAEKALTALKAVGPTVVAVAGNMDPPRLEETFLRLGVSVNGTGTCVGDTGFFGVSASPVSPLQTPYEITEAEILRRAEQGWTQVSGARWKVFVPHAPPKETSLDMIRGGRHVGSSAVREFVERRSPDLLICGHIHESRGTGRLGQTLMVNCGQAGNGSHAVITIDKTVSIELRG